jgi:hypothetical protein
MEFFTLQYQNQKFLNKFNEEFLTAASRFHVPANPIWTTFLSEYFAFLLSVWLQYRPIIIFYSTNIISVSWNHEERKVFLLLES